MRTFSSALVRGVPLLALVTACAAGITSSPSTRTGVTSLQAPEAPTPADQPSTYDPRGTLAANALAVQDYAKVLELTQDIGRAPNAAWLDYDRASALVGLRRTDEAVDVFTTAEQRFRALGDDEGLAAAIWGRARAFAEVGRCIEARRAFEDYATLVRQTDPGSARLAASLAADCRTPVILR